MVTVRTGYDISNTISLIVLSVRFRKTECCLVLSAAMRPYF